MNKLRPPTKGTLRSKGITEEEWYILLDMQDGQCPICLREFTEQLRPCIDHEHVTNFKKMKPEMKKRFVRGLTCSYCNLRRLPKGSKALNLTPTDISYNIYQYFTDYEMRRNDN